MGCFSHISPYYWFEVITLHLFFSFLLKLVKSGLKEHLIFANKSQSHYHLHLLAKLYFQKHYKNVKRLTKMCQSGVRFICRDGSIPESETSVVSCALSEPHTCATLIRSQNCLGMCIGIKALMKPEVLMTMDGRKQSTENLVFGTQVLSPFPCCCFPGSFGTYQGRVARRNSFVGFPDLTLSQTARGLHSGFPGHLWAPSEFPSSILVLFFALR